ALDVQVLAQGPEGFEIAFEVDVLVQKRLAQGEHFRRPEHAPQRPGMTQDERESFGLTRFRRPLRTVPAADGKIMPVVVFQEILEKSEADEGNGIWGCCGGWGHEILLLRSGPFSPRALQANGGFVGV